MKNKILILILGLILLSSSVFGAEFNMSFDSYGYTGTWANPTNYADLDWSTFATASSTSTFYFNYTGQNCEYYNWLIKDSGGTDTLVISGIQTLTPIELKTEFVDASNFVKYYYWTGAAWSQLKISATGAASYDFYEQILSCNSTQEELLYYNFSVLGTSNEIVNDSAHNFNGDLTNFNINSGEINGATISDGVASFDGSNDYIETNLNLYNNGTETTISFWAMQNNFETEDFYIFGDSTTAYQYLKLASTGRFVLEGNLNGNICYTGTSVTNIEGWHYYTVILNNNVCTFYVDNINYPTSVNSYTNGDLDISYIGKSGTSFSNGSISKLQVFDYALNTTQITSLYNNQSIKNSILNYDFEHLNSTHVYDTHFLTNSTTTDEGFYLGDAMDFDGVDDYIKINPIDLDSDSFSISYWSNFTGDSGDEQYGTSNYVFYSASVGNYILQYYKRYIITRFNDVSYYFPDTRFLWNNYNHFALKGSDYNSTHSLLTLFINSVEAIQENPVYMEKGIINLDQIGSRQTYFVEGSIDEVRIFNRELTPIEIYSLYHYNTLTPPAEYTVFYAQNIYTNETYQDFTIGYKNLDTLETGSVSTTEGFIPLLLSDSVTYEINITSDYFATQINTSFDPTLENYTFKVYDNNSVLVYVYNEETNALMANINITMDYMINGFYNQNITNTSSFYLSELLSGLYEFRFSSTGYYNRYYYLNIQNSNHYLLNAYLIDTSTGVLRNFIAQCTGSAVRNATISIYKLINGNYVTIAQRLTDYTGLAPFYLNPATTYKIIITTEDYTTFTSSITPSSSPIAFDLCGEGSAQPFNWTTLYDLFSYLIDEETLINASVHTFNLDASSPSGSIVSFGLTANGSTSIVTGSPAGGSTSITVNLTNATGTVPVTYMFNITGYDQYNFTKIFVIKSFQDIGNYSYTNIFEDYKDEIPTGWRYIIVTFIAILLMTLLYKFLDPLINSFVGLFVFVTFVYFGWVSVVFLVPMGALLIVFYLSERGGF